METEQPASRRDSPPKMNVPKIDPPPSAARTKPPPAKQAEQSYYFSKILSLGFDQALRRTAEALKREGFGIITEIDVKETLKAKIGVEFRNYRILGACNPKLAHEALQLEDKIGTMLPCNVVVQEISGDRTEIAAIDPVASMLAINNPRLKQAAVRVQKLLRHVIDTL
jgi:uncharacterized protein (DUF302 family)